DRSPPAPRGHLGERRPAAAPIRHAARRDHRAARPDLPVRAGEQRARRTPQAAPERCMTGGLDLGWWGVLLAIVAGAIRVSPPYPLVSLGETRTERSGRVNIGLEGTLVLGAMSAFATSYLTGSPWLGLLAAGLAGAALGLLHALICNLPRVNDIAVGIALFIFGIGLAF